MSIYLDAAATTKPKRQVLDVMMPYFTVKWYNPSALYNEANKVKEDIYNARKAIGDYINAKAEEIFFTSGGSESNSWAIQGFINHCIAKNKKPCIVTSVIEHKSILSCIENQTYKDIDKCFIRVDSDGFVDLQELKNALSCAYHLDNAILVSIQFANNEIGTIQHIKEISELAHKYNAIFHTDAVQAFGQIPIDVKELGIDMMSVSGHKIGTPKGIGFLYKNSTVEINPLIYGNQMNGLRGGTENVPYIIGLEKAVQLVQRDDEYQLRLTVLRKNFITMLKGLGCKLNGAIDDRLPNNINVTFNHDITGEALIYMLETSGIYIAAGSACNSNAIEPSYVLKAIGLNDENANKTIRITLPDNITMDEICAVIDEIEKAIRLIESN